MFANEVDQALERRAEEPRRADREDRSNRTDERDEARARRRDETRAERPERRERPERPERAEREGRAEREERVEDEPREAAAEPAEEETRAQERPERVARADGSELARELGTARTPLEEAADDVLVPVEELVEPSAEVARPTGDEGVPLETLPVAELAPAEEVDARGVTLDGSAPESAEADATLARGVEAEGVEPEVDVDPDAVREAPVDAREPRVAPAPERAQARVGADDPVPTGTRPDVQRASAPAGEPDEAPVEEVPEDPAVDPALETRELAEVPAEEVEGELLRGEPARPGETATRAAGEVGRADGVRAEGAATPTREAGVTQPAAPETPEDVKRPEQTAAAQRRPQVFEVERAAEILRQIRFRMAGGVRSASIQLLPAELGRISINIAVTQGRMAAVVRAESRDTLELLEKHVPELRSALASQGIEAESLQLELGLGQSDQAGGEADRDVRTPSPRANEPLSRIDEARTTRDQLARAARVGPDGVDTYA